MQNKNDIKQYGKQKKSSFLSSLVLKKRVKPAYAESFGEAKPAYAKGFGEAKKDGCLNTVDLRGKVLLEKQLKRIVDIKPRVLKKEILQEQQKAPKVWVGRKKAYPLLWRFFQVPQMLLRTVAVLLIIGLNWTAFAAVGTTVAIFHDEESARGTLSAGSVEFSLAVTPFDTIAAALNLETGTSTSKSVNVDPDGESNPFQYYASSTAFGGDEYFCDALLVSVLVDGTEIFNGQLEDLITATTTALDTWEFIFTTGTDYPNSVCHFDIDFNGWQTRNDLPSYMEGGYKDTETISNSIYSSGFRIQKVYFDQEANAVIVTGDATANSTIVNVVNTNVTDIVCDCDCEGDDCDDECDDSCGDVVVVNDNDATIINNVTVSANTGDNSVDGTAVQPRGWVEIYNQTNVALDFSGWKICNGIACDTIPSDVASIPAHGFAVITEDATLWHEWNIPNDVVLIELSDGTIGSGIDPVADMVLIQRPDEVVIDQMNWGVPSYAWLNYNSDVWDPGISVSTSTEVLAREPLGYDTNQPEDFVELGLPVVDLLYPDEECDDVWFWTYTYPIEWDAFNQNGGDEELLVDIFVIFDENGNGNLDEGDTAQAIALGIVNGVNGGEYSWTVPTGFIGMIWIQVVAVGPENPMLFSGTISGDIWDPIPEEMAGNYKDEYFAQQLGFKGFRVGAAPVQVPVQIPQDQTSGTTETPESFVGEEDPEEVVGDEGVGAEESSVPADDTGEVDDEGDGVLTGDEETKPAVAESSGVAKPAVAESFGEAKETLLDDDPLVGGEEDLATPESGEVLPEDEERMEEPPVGEEEPEEPEETEPEVEATLPEETQTNTEGNENDE